MRKLFSNISHINNKFYSWILFFFSLVLILFPALCIVYIKDTGIGTWALNKTPTFTLNVLTSMFAISLVYVSVLVFLILIFRMKINKTRLLLLAYISISLVLFSIPVFVKYLLPISLMEYLQYIFIDPTRIVEITTQSIPGFSSSYITAGSIIKIFMISLSLYVSSFLVIKNVFKINNFLNKKDLSSMNFIMLLLALAAMITFFYEVLLDQHSFLNGMTGPISIYIIQLSPFVLSQLYWIRKIRHSEFLSAVLSVIMILTISFSLYFDLSILFHRYYLPSSWSMISPTFVDMGILLGTLFFPLTSFILITLLYKLSLSFFEIVKVCYIKKDKRVFSFILFFVILILSFLLFNLFSSVPNDLKKDRHNGPVKYVKTNKYKINKHRKDLISFSSVQYNLEGNKTEENLPGIDSAVFRYEDGFLVEKKMFSDNGRLNQILRYDRDNSGNILKGELIIHNTNDQCNRHHYMLNNSDQSFMPTEDSSNGLSEEFCDYFEYKFYQSGRLSFSGNSTANFSYYYDATDKLTESYSYSKGDPEWDCIYSYNEYGDVVESSCCCDLDDIMNNIEEGIVERFEYKYDDYGNKISEISFVDGILAYKLSFTYKYDKFNNETEIQYFSIPFPQPYQVDYIEYEYY